MGLPPCTSSASAACFIVTPSSASPSSRTTPAVSTRARCASSTSASEGLSFLYVYDFGDNWEHVVEFERLLALDSAPRAASCIDGARARPLEDVGGVIGYAPFLDVIADPTIPSTAIPNAGPAAIAIPICSPYS